MSGGEALRVVRVVPDVIGIHRRFDYVVPAAWEADGRSERLEVGSMVRVSLHGRRVGAWVVELDVDPPPGISLAPLAKLRGVGPSAEMFELAYWAAWRWSGRVVHFLRAASPERAVAGRATARRAGSGPAGAGHDFDHVFEHEVAVVRLPPARDPLDVVRAAVRRGNALVVVPDVDRARQIAAALRRSGVDVALGRADWARAAGGCTVVGTRSAAWMPMPDLEAVVVVDEHDESLQNERTPTWHARDVAVERGRRAGAPVVLVSATPSLEALRMGPLLRPSRRRERDGWPLVEIVDRRDDDPVKGGLFPEALVATLRAPGRVVCVLNRVGRSRLLACARCGEIARTTDGTRPMVMLADELSTPDGSETRPVVCAACGSTVLKNLRMGVGRARDDLEALVAEPVDEVTSMSSAAPTSRVAIGTEAILHRAREADTVVFLDLDQELLAPRQRAVEQALALLARAARLVGGRQRGGRLVLNTRQPDHVVVRAAMQGDPSLVAVAERDRRKALRIPPYGAQALIRGSGAGAFAGALRAHDGVEVRGPVDEAYVVRADDQARMLDALAATERSDADVRVVVDPLRL